MSTVDQPAALPIRAHLVQNQATLIAHIAAPGTWWNGEERLAIARSARAAWTCTFCVDRKAAISPYAIDGVHDDDAGLEPALVDVVHRIVTDPGRLSRRLIDDTVERGVEYEALVELIAVALFTTALDVFHRAVGLEPLVLPAPTAGEPTRHRPTHLEHERAWVPRLVPEDPAWTDLYGERERVNEVERGLSLVPAEVAMLNAFGAAHYIHFDNVARPHFEEPDRAIDRMQMEFVASRVSAYHDCFY